MTRHDDIHIISLLEPICHCSMRLSYQLHRLARKERSQNELVTAKTGGRWENNEVVHRRLSGVAAGSECSWVPRAVLRRRRSLSLSNWTEKILLIVSS